MVNQINYPYTHHTGPRLFDPQISRAGLLNLPLPSPRTLPPPHPWLRSSALLDSIAGASDSLLPSPRTPRKNPHRRPPDRSAGHASHCRRVKSAGLQPRLFVLSTCYPRSCSRHPAPSPGGLTPSTALRSGPNTSLGKQGRPRTRAPAASFIWNFLRWRFSWGSSSIQLNQLPIHLTPASSIVSSLLSRAVIHIQH